MDSTILSVEDIDDSKEKINELRISNIVDLTKGASRLQLLSYKSSNILKSFKKTDETRIKGGLNSSRLVDESKIIKGGVNISKLQESSR